MGCKLTKPGELSSIVWATLDQVSLWGAASHLGDLKVWPGCDSKGISTDLTQELFEKETPRPYPSTEVKFEF